MKLINSNISKYSSLILEEKIWRYGPVYVITGNSFPIKDELERLGFKAYKLGQTWVRFMGKNTFEKLNPDRQKMIIQSLKSLNVNMGNIFNSQNEKETSSVERQEINQPPKNVALKGEKYPYTDQYVKDKEERTRSKYSFPIEKNILSYEITFELDGEQHTETVKINRTFKPGSTSDSYNITFNKEHRDFPIYEFEIGQTLDKKDPIQIIKISTKGEKTQRPWGTYNEREYLEETIKQFLIKAIPIKYSRRFREEYDIRKRDPKLNSFLKEIEHNFKDQRVTHELKIENGPYKGTYPVAIFVYSGFNFNLYMETALKNPLAPEPVTIANLSLLKIHTIEELDNLIQQTLSKKETKDEYIKYLESFPFLEDKKEEETEKFEEIKNSIKNKSIDIEHILQKIKEMNYIRPHRGQKQTGPGMTMGDEIKWVLDAEKIRNDIYGKGFLKSSPDFFYTVIAYYVLKAKTDQWSWTDMILMSSIRDWIIIMKKFGETFDMFEIKSTISAIGKEILYMVFGQESQTRSEQYYNFYYGGGFFGDESEEKIQNQTSGGAISNLENFARKLGFDPTGLTPKRLYRALTKLTHPDVNPTNPKAKEQFQELGRIWDVIPDAFKQASNWYDKITIG